MWKEQREFIYACKHTMAFTAPVFMKLIMALHGDIPYRILPKLVNKNGM